MEFSLDGPLGVDESASWLAERIKEYHLPGIDGQLGIHLSSSLELIGYCGLFQYPDIEGSRENEVSYRLLPQHWGNGYATEAARAIRDHAFSDLGIDRLVALIDPANVRSIRVAEKLGMVYEKPVLLEGYDHPDHLYAVHNAGR